MAIKIEALAALAAVGDFATGQGCDKTVDVSDAYINRLLQDYQGTQKD